jgi:DNA-binding transcriptional ArsR family regulator
VQWAPAYELLVSIAAYVSRRIHPHLELGEGWVREVRERLPVEFRPVLGVKHKDDCLLHLLLDGCPGERDVDGFLDWLAGLSPGAAYDALCNRMPRSGPQLPRDFPEWRDRMVERLRTWNDLYFRHVDPAILDALRAEVDSRRATIGSTSAREIIEHATNGLYVELDPALRCVVLVPQFHQRPYNDHDVFESGLVMLYPADVLPPAPDAPPTALLRLTRGLSDESRLRILRFLRTGPCTLTEVARFAGLSQPTVHHHLTLLRVAGLVRVHVYMSGAARYSLRPGAVQAVARQLDTYLESDKGTAR